MAKSSKESPNPIIRFHGTRLEDFVAVSRLFAQDDNVSLEAVGLVLYILSKPPNWEIRMGDLIRRSGKKAYSVRKILNELRDLYYARIEYILGDDGRLLGSRWVLYGDPEQNPDYQVHKLEQMQPKLNLIFDSPVEASEQEVQLKELYEAWGESRPRQPVEVNFMKLTPQDRREIKAVFEKYVQYNPNVKYRKALERYIDPVAKNWQTPLIDRREQPKINKKPFGEGRSGGRHVATNRPDDKFDLS